MDKNGMKWIEWIEVDPNDWNRPNWSEIEQRRLIFFFFKEKILAHTKFAPLNIFDIDNEVKNMINYVSSN